MSVLQVEHLCKRYPSFCLEDISFSLRPGKITGFIGRNGAGKSTTLKSLFHFVHPDEGSISFFGTKFDKDEIDIKQNVGVVFGGVDYYSKKRIKQITSVTKSFYKHWDDGAYQNYLHSFHLDESKKIYELSAGMKVKYAIALSLSHKAKLLVLDEPTSGLDPVSRDEILEIFMNLSDRGTAILFSTHIISDLEQCADDIIYIKNGRMLAQSSLSDFVDKYCLLNYQSEQLNQAEKRLLIGSKRTKTGWSALILKKDKQYIKHNCIKADLESIMVHLEKEDLNNA